MPNKSLSLRQSASSNWGRYSPNSEQAVAESQQETVIHPAWRIADHRQLAIKSAALSLNGLSETATKKREIHMSFGPAMPGGRHGPGPPKNVARMCNIQ